MKNPPLVRFSPLSGEIYVLTRYRVEINAKQADPKRVSGVVISSEKYPVTRDVEEAALQRKQWLRARRRRARRAAKG